MTIDNSQQSSSVSAVVSFCFSLALPVVGFCLLRDAHSGRDARSAWLIWTVLATVLLPLWHLWLHFWRAEGSLGDQFRSVMETSGRRVRALIVFVLPLLMTLVADADSESGPLCGFLWIVGLFCLCFCTVVLYAGGYDYQQRQTVDLSPLMEKHHLRGTISLRKGGYWF
jgi:hypothetical protein